MAAVVVRSNKLLPFIKEHLQYTIIVNFIIKLLAFIDSVNNLIRSVNKMAANT